MPIETWKKWLKITLKIVIILTEIDDPIKKVNRSIRLESLFGWPTVNRLPIPSPNSQRRNITHRGPVEPWPPAGRWLPVLPRNPHAEAADAALGGVAPAPLQHLVRVELVVLAAGGDGDAAVAGGAGEAGLREGNKDLFYFFKKVNMQGRTENIFYGKTWKCAVIVSA